MKRILIIQLNWVGDILFTTPAIRTLRQAYPSSLIACLVVPRCIDMLSSNPDIDELILLDECGVHRGLLGKIRLISELRKKGFDTAISFHRSMTRMLIAALAGIPQRIGYATRKRRWLLTLPVADALPDLHRVEYFLGIVRALGIEPGSHDYVFNISEDSFARAEKLLEAHGLKKGEEFFVINPGGNWPPKRWLPQRYAELSKQLSARYNKKVLITGAAKDKTLGEEIVAMSGGSCTSICGETTLHESGAIMKKAVLVISNDSGPMHIAVSQKTPTIALFGPTSSLITGPSGDGLYLVLHQWKDCDIPCYVPSCNDYRCMEAISVKDVLAAVEELLSRMKKQKGHAYQ